MTAPNFSIPKVGVPVTPSERMSDDWYKFLYRLWEYVQNIVPSVTVGSIQYNIVTTAVGMTAAYGDFIQVNAAGGPVSITLPAAATTPGALIDVSKIDASANAVTVVGTINGVANFDLLLQDESITLVSDGTGFRII